MLVVESDPAQGFLIAESLRAAGYEPVECAAEQAPALAASLPAACVVASLSSVSYERAPLYRALRGDPRTRNTPIVICTGRGDATLRRRLGEKPPHVLFKPYELDVLVATVKKAIAEPDV